MTPRPGSMPLVKLSAYTTPSRFLLSPRIHRRLLAWRAFIYRSEFLFSRSKLTTSIFASSLTHNRSLAQVRAEPLSELWFTASFPAKLHDHHGYKSEDGNLKSTTESGPPTGPGGDHKMPDERTLKLGKTLRSLSPLLPAIFTSPLPNDLLSPNISLHLFPSTHPHLPVVKSRVPYRAALWTAPMAWGTVPIVGNVRIEIVSEKVVRTGFVSAPLPPALSFADQDNADDISEEKLVVRWKTEKKKNGNRNRNGEARAAAASAQSLSSSSKEINRGLSTLLGGSQPLFSKGSEEPFTGLFIFSFDREGKIASMTIEHADESQGFDKTNRVVTLTDWLLGKARWGRVEGGLVPGLAYRGSSNGNEVWCRDNVNSEHKITWKGRRWD